MDSVFRADAFAGRVVLVTGGATGIGLALARAFAAHGADVAIASRKLENCQAAAAEIEKTGRRALALGVNVREPEAVQIMADAVFSHFGQLDVLICNAGANFLAPATQITPNGFRAVVETVLFGTFFCAQACAKHMIAQNRGRIISLAATNGMNGSPLMAHSGAAKAGVINLMATLAAEWAPFGITANSLSPGAVDTPGAGSRLWNTPRMQAQVADEVPLGRMAVPGDLIGAALFLASDAARFITGANLVVDGGEIVRHLGRDFLSGP